MYKTPSRIIAWSTNILLLRDTANLYDARRAVDGSCEIGLQHRKLGDGVLLRRGGLVVMMPRGGKRDQITPPETYPNIIHIYIYIQTTICVQRHVVDIWWQFVFGFFSPFLSHKSRQKRRCAVLSTRTIYRYLETETNSFRERLPRG